MNVIVINSNPGKGRNTTTLLKSAMKGAAGCRSALGMGKRLVSEMAVDNI